MGTWVDEILDRVLAENEIPDTPLDSTATRKKLAGRLKEHGKSAEAFYLEVERQISRDEDRKRLLANILYAAAAAERKREVKEAAKDLRENFKEVSKQARKFKRLLNQIETIYHGTPYLYSTSLTSLDNLIYFAGQRKNDNDLQRAAFMTPLGRITMQDLLDVVIGWADDNPVQVTGPGAVFESRKASPADYVRAVDSTVETLGLQVGNAAIAGLVSAISDEKVDFNYVKAARIGN